MSRIQIPAHDEAHPATKLQLDAVQKQLGMVPNLYRLTGNSLAALEAMLTMTSTLSKALDARTRERIALAVAQVNNCSYCLSAHTYLGLNLAKLDSAEIALNRQGRSGDAKADAAVKFAATIAGDRGRVSDADIAAVKLAGYSDAQIVEIVALVALNFYTNLINNVAKTDIDFPVVEAKAA